MSTPQSRPKRKYRHRHRPPKDPQTVQTMNRIRRLRANNRERNRMQALNQAMETLRQLLPSHLYEYRMGDKLSKIETLRMAYQYIADLRQVLKEAEESKIIPESSKQMQQIDLVPLDGENFKMSATGSGGFEFSTVQDQFSFNVDALGPDLEWYTPISMDCPKLPTLETPRLRLMEMDPDTDVETVNSLYLDTFDTVHPWIPSAQKPPSIEDTLQSLKDMQEKRAKGYSCPFGIFEKTQNNLIGMCSLMKLDSPLGDRSRDQIDSPHKNPWLIGYWVNKRYEGQGFASEACMAMMEFGFTYLNVDCYFAEIDARNGKSLGVVKRTGFEYWKQIMSKNTVRSDWPDVMPVDIYRKVM